MLFSILILKVLNVAIQVDGRYPISCAARIIDSPVIILRSLRINRTGSNMVPSSTTQNDHGGNIEIKRVYVGDDDSESVVCSSWESFSDVSNPAASCALLKAVLIVLRVVRLPQPGMDNRIEAVKHETFTERLYRICGGGTKATATSDSLLAAGLEIACCSDLPTGSGMGGSSILASAALTAVSHVLGMRLSRESLVYLVGQVEQGKSWGWFSITMDDKICIWICMIFEYILLLVI